MSKIDFNSLIYAIYSWIVLYVSLEAFLLITTRLCVHTVSHQFKQATIEHSSFERLSNP